MGVLAYDAFVSCGHDVDGRLAPAVQKGLQRLAKRWYRPRALRVFRDETGLSANPHLWSSIQTALDDSGWFILLASPDAAVSPWVNREVEHWLGAKSADPILCVLTDGEWAWDATRSDFEPDRSSAVPARMPKRAGPFLTNAVDAGPMRFGARSNRLATVAADLQL